MSKNIGLGRGLSSLIPEEPSESTAGEGVREIQVDLILPDSKQPRYEFAEDKINELAASIKEHGVLQPLIVSELGGGEYQLIAGERRLHASKKAGLEKVPVIVRSVSEQQRLEVSLVENLQRTDLNPLEKAKAFKRLMDEFNLTQEQVAKQVGKSREAVANTLRVLYLPEEIQQALMKNEISEGHAKAILGLSGDDAKLKMLKSIKNESLSVRDLEKKVRAKKGKKRIRVRKSPEFKELEERLRGKLGTKVEIKKGRKGGEVIIEFYSEGELSNIIDQICGKDFSL